MKALFPYDLISGDRFTRYQVRILPDEDEDPSAVTVRSDFSLSDIIHNIRQQDCEVLAVRRSGAWHHIKN